MTNKEAIEIKEEILNKVGEIRIGPVKVCDNIVDITDVLDIINRHVDKKVRITNEKDTSIFSQSNKTY